MQYAISGSSSAVVHAPLAQCASYLQRPPTATEPGSVAATYGAMKSARCASTRVALPYAAHAGSPRLTTAATSPPANTGPPESPLHGSDGSAASVIASAVELATEVVPSRLRPPSSAVPEVSPKPTRRTCGGGADADGGANAAAEPASSTSARSCASVSSYAGCATASRTSNDVPAPPTCAPANTRYADGASCTPQCAAVSTTRSAISVPLQTSAPCASTIATTAGSASSGAPCVSGTASKGNHHTRPS